MNTNELSPFSKVSRLNRKIQPPWITKDLAHLIAKKKHLWIVNQHSGTNTKAVDEEYKKVRRELKKSTKRAVIDYEKAIINDKGNKKRVFSYVKSKQKNIEIDQRYERRKRRHCALWSRNQQYLERLFQVGFR
jgi:hypothetical protein